MSKFDENSYYRLITDEYGGVDKAMNTGDLSLPSVLNVNSLTSFYNSQNWQFHYQDGVYFIRNYLYNTTYNLGLDKYLLSAPRMLPATSELGQQWLIDTWTDGSYRFTNRLITSRPGNITYMGIGDRWNTVLMLSMESGAHWTVTKNPDRGAVSADMTHPYSAIETPSAVVTPTYSSLPTSSSATTDNGVFYQPGSIRPIDIAGIVVGIFVCIFVIVVFLMFWRRYKKHGHLGHKGVPGPTPVPRTPRHHGDAEVLPEPPPAYNSRPSASFTNQSSSMGDVPDYYARHNTRRKAADEESIELPPYGRPTTETRSFV